MRGGCPVEEEPRPPRAIFRIARWAVIVLPLVDVVLVATGLLDPHVGLVVGLTFEILLAGVVVAEAVAFRRAYRRARSAGSGRANALSTGLSAALPAPVGWFLRTEAGILRALWWAVRRRRAVEPAVVVLPYTDRIGVLLWMTAALGAVESVVVHVLVLGVMVRWVLLGLSVYGLLWVVGLAFSLRQHPHVLRGSELLLRFGHFRTTRVPLAGLVGARRDIRTGHKHNVEIHAGTLSLSVAGETSVELALEPAAEVEMRGRIVCVSRVRFFADDPGSAVRLLRERAATPPG
jgi:hypothetical protein